MRPHRLSARERRIICIREVRKDIEDPYISDKFLGWVFVWLVFLGLASFLIVRNWDSVREFLFPLAYGAELPTPVNPRVDVLKASLPYEEGSFLEDKIKAAKFDLLKRLGENGCFIGRIEVSREEETIVIEAKCLEWR